MAGDPAGMIHHDGGGRLKRPRSPRDNDQGATQKRQRTENLDHGQCAQTLESLDFNSLETFGQELGYSDYVTPFATMHQVAPAQTTTAAACHSAPNGISPYSAAYHGSLPANVTRSTTTRSGLKIGPLSLEQAQLAIPAHLSSADKAALKTRLQEELNRQRDHAPALPRSQVPGLPPKEFMPEYKKIDEHATPQEKARIRTYNARISKELQRIDRQRNNQAAKKSRETRLEALRLTRDMLNRKAAECDWLRLKVLQLNGDPADYDNLADQTKRRLVEVVETRVREIDQKYAEEKKQAESRKRAERTRQRAEARELETLTPNYFLDEIVPPQEALTATVGEDGTYVDNDLDEDGEEEEYEDGDVLDEHVLERNLYLGHRHDP